MVDPHPLLREGVGRELEQNSDRRRARILGRILDLAAGLNSVRDPSMIADAIGTMIRALFPECRYLVLLSRSPGLGAELRGHTLAEPEFALVRPVAERVASTGIPAFTSDYAVNFAGIGACMPVRSGEVSIGALHASIPYGVVASSDELASYLRRVAGLAGSAWRFAVDWQNLKTAPSQRPTPEIDQAQDAPLAHAKRLFEAWLIRSRLEEAKGNIAAAARTLDMDRGQLSRLVKKHGIDRRDYRRRGNP